MSSAMEAGRRGRCRTRSAPPKVASGQEEGDRGGMPMRNQKTRASPSPVSTEGCQGPGLPCPLTLGKPENEGTGRSLPRFEQSCSLRGQATSGLRQDKGACSPRLSVPEPAPALTADGVADSWPVLLATFVCLGCKSHPLRAAPHLPHSPSYWCPRRAYTPALRCHSGCPLSHLTGLLMIDRLRPGAEAKI